MNVSETTRKHLMDELAVSRHSYNGSMTESEFLGRLFDLRALPTKDRRLTQFPDMLADLIQHRGRNPNDWDDDWVFHDDRLNLRGTSDEKLLEFLALMVDPMVRPDENEAKELLGVFNKHLQYDGIEFIQTGTRDNRPQYGARPTGSTPAVADLRAATLAQLGVQVRQQLNRLDPEGDPGLTIGTAKDILESVCKTILDQFGESYAKDAQLPGLAKQVSGLIEVAPVTWRKADETVRKLLGNLWTIPQSLCELRNLAGTGHGRPAGAPDLLPMHARLAADAAATFAHFMIDAARRTSSPGT